MRDLHAFQVTDAILKFTVTMLVKSVPNETRDGEDDRDLQNRVVEQARSERPFRRTEFHHVDAALGAVLILGLREPAARAVHEDHGDSGE